jgi:hypothetical protein
MHSNNYHTVDVDDSRFLRVLEDIRGTTSSSTTTGVTSIQQNQPLLHYTDVSPITSSTKQYSLLPSPQMGINYQQNTNSNINPSSYMISNHQQLNNESITMMNSYPCTTAPTPNHLQHSFPHPQNDIMSLTINDTLITPIHLLQYEASKNKQMQQLRPQLQQQQQQQQHQQHHHPSCSSGENGKRIVSNTQIFYFNNQ